MSSTLSNSTGNINADQAIRDLIKSIQSKLNNQLIAVYLSGSYANNYAVPTSDVDLYFIFQNDISKSELLQLESIEKDFTSIEPPLDLVPFGLEKIREYGIVEMSKNFSHLWGEEVHKSIPNPNIEDYIYRSMHGAYLFMQRTRTIKPYVWPLSAPDDKKIYQGYCWRPILFRGSEVESVKELVVYAGWIATALVAWKGKKYVGAKQECVKLFSDVIGGEYAEAFSKITELGRNKLHYLFPITSEDKEELTNLLARMLKLENYFLEEYQKFLIQNLMNANSVRVRTSMIRLGEIFYTNNYSLEALRKVKIIDPTQEEAYKTTMDFLRTIEPK